ncbi:prenyltransferase/squalene oxidase repeat-containing protein [Streptomyces sp. NPDC007264]|uniref:prenyltransferase/squalene oxidase repeat-containing protein n=1 Tax=Streptomyces sp. NPDC007264 TaxID=3364777 RepID=UPI0036D8647D
MNVRRSAVALAATAVIGAAAPAAATGPSPSPSPVIPSGLYGSTDPTYDGVWRQSLALLAQHTTGVRPAARAVDWLAGQQCANGAFAAFRANPGTPCDAKLMVDTNSTAAAVQALTALGGHDAATGKAVAWLKSVQNKDGGWGYTPGGASDANSTSVVIGALAAAGANPAQVHADGGDGTTPQQLLASWSVPCGGHGGGALAYQPDKHGKLAPNADATAAGVLAALGKGFVASAGKAPRQESGCAGSGKPLTSREVAANGAAYLAGATAATGHLTSALPGAGDQPDYGNTADAVVALAAQGRTEAAQKPYAWLEKNSAQWARQSGPAAYAQLILAAHAMGADPHRFGGTDLVTALNGTGPAPQAAERSDGTGRNARSGSDSGPAVWWIVGVGLVAGIGVGFLLSGRTRKRRQP